MISTQAQARQEVGDLLDQMTGKSDAKNFRTMFREIKKLKEVQIELVKWIACSGTEYEQRLYWMKKWGSGEASVHRGILERVAKDLQSKKTETETVKKKYRMKVLKKVKNV